MLNLRRRWQNLKLASRLVVVVAMLAVAAFAALAIFIQTQGTFSSGKVAARPNLAVNPTTPPPTPVSFSYAVAPDTTVPPPPQNEAARLLMLANRYLADGEPIDAAAQYRLIISSYPKSTEATEASFGLAQASAARSRWSEADALYKKFLNDYPTDVRRRLALFKLAEIQKAQGFWEAAINYYQQYLQDKNGKLLEGYVYFDMADCLENSLKKDQAVEYFKKAGESLNASNQLRANALERVGDYYVAAGNPGAAVGWYNKILDIAKVTSYRADIMLKMARAYAAAKQTTQANTTYNVILDQYLETPAGLTALNALNTANPTATSDFYQGYLAYRSNNWASAITAFSKVLGRSDEKAAPNLSPPLPATQTPTEQEKTARAWFWLGRSFEQKSDPTRAANEYRELQIRLPRSEMSQEAIWRVALILQNAGQAEAAATQYGYIAATYPAGRYAEEALANQADIVLARSGPEAAQALINSFADKFLAGELRNAALYDLYRAFEAKGNKEAARTALQKAATSSSADYYALRAVDILAGQNPLNVVRSNPLTHPAAYDPVRFAKDAEADRKTMESWLTTWAGPVSSLTTTPTPSPANPLESSYQATRNDEGLKRLAELHQLGRNGQASREAREAIDRFAGKPTALYLLSLFFNEQGEYYYSISAAQEVLSLYRQLKPGASLRATPLMLQKLIYPLDYQNLVLEHSRRNNLDPLLLLALIKQESAFDSDATSSVGARGLTQVMPETGRGIATNLDKPNFNADDLYRPAMAVEFGAYYLGHRLQDYQGNPYSALAAYNGGAGNVDRWAAANPPERGFDNFVERIDYPETRNYLKIIYASYAMYRQLYKAAGG